MFPLRMVRLLEAHAGKLLEGLMSKFASSENCPQPAHKVAAHENEHEIYCNRRDWDMELLHSHGRFFDRAACSASMDTKARIKKPAQIRLQPPASFGWKTA